MLISNCALILVVWLVLSRVSDEYDLESDPINVIFWSRNKLCKPLVVDEFELYSESVDYRRRRMIRKVHLTGSKMLS